MKYRIIASEVKETSTGKTYKRATVQDTNGASHEVSVWSDFPDYAKVEAHNEVEGTIRENGKYKNLVGDRPKTTKKGFDATVAVAMKQEGIKRSQDRKEDSIKISGTARDATLITVALMQSGTVSAAMWKDKWLEVRDWLLENYDVATPNHEIY